MPKVPWWTPASSKAAYLYIGVTLLSIPIFVYYNLNIYPLVIVASIVAYIYWRHNELKDSKNDLLQIPPKSDK